MKSKNLTGYLDSIDNSEDPIPLYLECELEKENRITIPELSEWKCYLFGSSHDSSHIMWEPEKGKEPNWFWRWMQYLCFGNKWVKKK